MNTFFLNFEKEMAALQPEDAESIQRVLIELLAMARRKQTFESSAPNTESYILPTRDLSVRPGPDLTKLAHFDEDGLDA